MFDLREVEPESLRRLKRSEFQELVELGAFEDERVELLCGFIFKMSPPDPPHDGPVTQLTMLLVPQLVGRAKARVQCSMLAEFESQPSPDFAIVPDRSYQKAHPAGALLAIEVSWSSLRKDRKIKRPLYAASGVLEYWIVNVEEQRIEVYADSDGERYQSEASYGLGERVSLRAFPDVSIAVADVFA